MKKITFLSGLPLLAILLGGCVETAVINGNEYEVLSTQEEQQLVVAARQSLRHSPKSLTPAEHKFVQEKQPEINITYTGDRSGKAHLYWRTPKKTIDVVMTGEFLSDQMAWMLRTEDVPPEVLDLRPKNQRTR